MLVDDDAVVSAVQAVVAGPAEQLVGTEVAADDVIAAVTADDVAAADPTITSAWVVPSMVLLPGVPTMVAARPAQVGAGAAPAEGSKPISQAIWAAMTIPAARFMAASCWEHTVGQQRFR